MTFGGHALPFCGWRFLLHEREPLAGRDFLIVLMEAAVNKDQDARSGLPRLSRTLITAVWTRIVSS
jgi:hypothetical protein